MLRPTVDEYILFVGLPEAIAQSSLASPSSPNVANRADVRDEVIEFAIGLAVSEVLSYLGDRYTDAQLSSAIGLPRMVLQIARWNLDQRIEPRDFIRDQYLEVLTQLKQLSTHETGLWLQPMPGEGTTPPIDPTNPVEPLPPTPPTRSRSIRFGGGIAGFGDQF